MVNYLNSLVIAFVHLSILSAGPQLGAEWSRHHPQMFGLTPIDLLVIAAYLAAAAIIGHSTRSKIRTQEQYFLAGRRSGKVLQIFASFGYATTPEGPVGVATTTFYNGIAGVWTSLLMVFCTPLFWFTSALLRRMRVMTMGDFFAERYDSPRMAAAYAIVAAAGMMSVLSAGYIATSVTTSAVTMKSSASWTNAERQEYALSTELGGLEERVVDNRLSPERERLNELRSLSPRSVFPWLPPRTVIWVACAITILNGAFGGLTAAFYASILQGCCVVAMSTLLVPFGFARIHRIYDNGDGSSALKILHERLPHEFFQVFGSAGLPDFTWYYILTVAFVAGITVVLQPNQLVTSAAAKDESAASIGFVTGSIAKRFCTILWAVAGMIAALLYATSLKNSDLVWGKATEDLLGPAKCGLVGLMLVGMLSALMAVSNSLMLTIAGLITANLYRPLFPGRSEKHYVICGRVAGVAFLAGSALVATQYNALLDVIKLNWEFFTIFSAAFWLGLKWRRASRVGAWTSILATAMILYVIPLVLPSLIPSVRVDPTLALQTIPRNTTLYGVSVGRESAVRVAPHSIFWSQGLGWSPDGKRIGRGYPYLDLLLLHYCGIDLRNNSYALNETIRILLRIALPFAIMMAVSCSSPIEQSPRLERFYVKMRTRVSSGGGKADETNVEAALSRRGLGQEIKLFPGSNWEIYRWSRYDVLGFTCSTGLVLIVVGLLWLITL